MSRLRWLRDDGATHRSRFILKRRASAFLRLSVGAKQLLDSGTRCFAAANLITHQNNLIYVSVASSGSTKELVDVAPCGIVLI